MYLMNKPTDEEIKSERIGSLLKDSAINGKESSANFNKMMATLNQPKSWRVFVDTKGQF